MMHGWQSESTDGPKGGWSCAFPGMVVCFYCIEMPKVLRGMHASACLSVIYSTLEGLCRCFFGGLAG